MGLSASQVCPHLDILVPTIKTNCQQTCFLAQAIAEVFLCPGSHRGPCWWSFQYHQLFLLDSGTALQQGVGESRVIVIMICLLWSLWPLQWTYMDALVELYTHTVWFTGNLCMSLQLNKQMLVHCGIYVMIAHVKLSTLQRHSCIQGYSRSKYGMKTGCWIRRIQWQCVYACMSKEMCKCYGASDSFSVTAELVVMFSCCNNSDFFVASRRNTTSVLTQVMIRSSL